MPKTSEGSPEAAIVAHIAAETARLGTLAAVAARSIALLKDRRSALIAAAVTGQVRIPGLEVEGAQPC